MAIPMPAHNHSKHPLHRHRCMHALSHPTNAAGQQAVSHHPRKVQYVSLGSWTSTAKLQTALATPTSVIAPQAAANTARHARRTGQRATTATLAFMRRCAPEEQSAHAHAASCRCRHRPATRAPHAEPGGRARAAFSPPMLPLLLPLHFRPRQTERPLGRARARLDLLRCVRVVRRAARGRHDLLLRSIHALGHGRDRVIRGRRGLIPDCLGGVRLI